MIFEFSKSFGLIAGASEDVSLRLLARNNYDLEAAVDAYHDPQSPESVTAATSSFDDLSETDVPSSSPPVAHVSNTESARPNTDSNSDPSQSAFQNGATLSTNLFSSTSQNAMSSNPYRYMGGAGVDDDDSTVLEDLFRPPYDIISRLDFFYVSEAFI